MLQSKKKEIINAINKNLDIPFLDEDDEKALLETLWAGIEQGVMEGIKK